MKLHQLQLEGFGPFLRRQVIDFDEYEADGLFLISGKTGAGKSSILDAVCFALYGQVPRYDGNGAKRVRSDHSRPTDQSEVQLTFTTNGVTYRVTRTPEYMRTKASGTGLTKVATRVLLEQRVGGRWHGLAARAVDVGRHLDRIVQLSREQFLQVILLAQNRFAQFLLASSKDRQSLLQALFGTKRFEEYQEELNDRRRASEQQIATYIARVNDRLDDAEQFVREQERAGDPADDADTAADAPDTVGPRDESAAARIARLHDAVSRGALRAEALEVHRARADAERISAAETLATLRARRAQQQQRDDAQRSLAALGAQAEQIARDRMTLRAARAALAIVPLRETAARYDAALDQSERALQIAADAWHTAADAETCLLAQTAEGEQPLADSAPLTSDVLRAHAKSLTEDLGRYAPALETEQQLDALATSVTAAESTTLTAQGRIDELQAEAADLPDSIVAAESRIAVLTDQVTRIPDLATRTAEAREKMRASQQISEAERAVEAATRASAEANLASTKASQEIDQLYHRRLTGYAAELASELTPHEPCPVCGGVDHPHPAEGQPEPVTQADVDAARAARDACDRIRAEATAHETAQRDRLTSLLVVTGEHTAAELSKAYDDVLRESDAATQAEHDRVAALTERDRLRDRQSEMTTAVTREQEAIARATEAHIAAVEKHRCAFATVTAARGRYAAVADRVAALRQYRDLATEYAHALEEVTHARSRSTEAHDTVMRALRETPFETAEQAGGAARTAAERDELEKRIFEHDAAVQAATATLYRLHDEHLPLDPIDVSAAANAAEAAQQTWARVGVHSAEVVADVAHLRTHIDVVVETYRAHEGAIAAHDAIVRLADTVSGREPNTMRMSLETFILAAELEQIVAAANLRLSEMSSGRYRLQHSDEKRGNAAAGLGIDIFDSFTSKARPAHSLSGGETFLASLALALGLAEVVTNRAGGVRLDTLFIDEGFGSLDSDTLDVAMQTLDELRAGGRIVGLISHVEAMKEQIPAQIRVSIAADGSSDIQVR